MKRNKSILIENAQLMFKNFEGVAGKFNPPGIRNFCVKLDPEVAESLAADGWRIRYLEPREEDGDRLAYMSVAVSYAKRPPKIVMISSRGKSVIPEEDLKILDWAEMENVDLMINPSDWEMNGNSGRKAYLQSMYVTIYEDALEQKYNNAPDSAADAIGGCGNCDTCDGNCGCHEHSTI